MIISVSVTATSRANPAATARRFYTMRRRSERGLGADLFGESGWDTLLYLYATRAEGNPVTAAEACRAATVPASTALRWLIKLDREGHVRRYLAADDDRIILIEITEATFDR